jgi:histidinol dehydrogenase
MRIINGFEEARQALSRRVAPQSYAISAGLAASLKTMFGTDDPAAAVAKIIEDVRLKGDQALKDYTKLIDRVELEAIEVSPAEIIAAKARIAPELLSAIETAAGRVREFHRKQFKAFTSGVKKMAPGTVARVLGRVGMYVPGGTASYPSSVLMTAIPASAAGVKEIIVCTPPGKNGRIPDMTLAAASIAGVSRVFAAGGAQAIAAMAYGTESVPPVDKICGPGNIFVMLAKKYVYGSVDIDGLQGPSEVIVIADAKADASWCAGDLLAQAEHDGMAQSILITTSADFSSAVLRELDTRLGVLSRKTVIKESLASRGVICVVENMDQAVELANLYAPEHLCLYTEDSERIARRITNAGCVFMGTHPTVVMGDYVAGPSHALPTGGTARFASPLNTTDFVRLMNVVEVNARMMTSYGPVAAILAEAEGLSAHASALELPAEKAKRKD